MIEKSLVEMLCCPSCQGNLGLESESMLACKKCKRDYLVKDNIPVLLLERI